MLVAGALFWGGRASLRLAALWGGELWVGSAADLGSVPLVHLTWHRTLGVTVSFWASASSVEWAVESLSGLRGRGWEDLMGRSASEATSAVDPGDARL